MFILNFVEKNQCLMFGLCPEDENFTHQSTSWVILINNYSMSADWI